MAPLLGISQMFSPKRASVVGTDRHVSRFVVLIILLHRERTMPLW